MDIKDITSEDKIGFAEAYRVYETMLPEEKELIPQDFIDKLIEYGDFDEVKPFASKEEALNYDFSKKGLYLIMYMCTFK